MPIDKNAVRERLQRCITALDEAKTEDDFTLLCDELLELRLIVADECDRLAEEKRNG